jgi:hypothetical protein
LSIKAHIVATSGHFPVPLGTERLKLLVSLPGTSSLDARRALHRSLGDALQIYVLRVDHARTTVSLQIDTTPAALAGLLTALVEGLPEATIGRVSRRDH